MVKELQGVARIDLAEGVAQGVSEMDSRLVGFGEMAGVEG